MNAYVTLMFVGFTFLLGSVCCADQAKTSGLNGASNANESARPKARCETPYRAIRLIEDPSTHLRWMLLKDLRHPTAPAMLVPVPNSSACIVHDGEDRGAVESIFFRPPAVPVIRGGEKLIVEEHSSAADAQLEGTALGPAAMGEAFRVRLKKSGKILSVVADGPGRATMLAGRSEVGW